MIAVAPAIAVLLSTNKFVLISTLPATNTSLLPDKACPVVTPPTSNPAAGLLVPIPTKLFALSKYMPVLSCARLPLMSAKVIEPAV